MSTVSYINLARKYRPQIINDLIGQNFLVKTLENSFMLNKISHAFMLTGVRGVGKTTTARIIAKALNCTGVDGNGGITLNPCGVCDSCVGINHDRNMDVIEMDAASKTGVDDIREIIENGQYKPVSSRYKVFIIDEIHMLSKNAFNALLKTLEEPPEHLKFIFATTEIKKVPLTILSRCQKFYLNRVMIGELRDHLKNICVKENIASDEESLMLIAKAGNGSVRDCLSLLDQAIVYCSNNLQSELINSMLGGRSIENLYNLFLHMVNFDINSVLEVFHEQYMQGLEIDILIEDLMGICHNCICAHMLNKKNLSSILQLSDFDMDQIHKINQVAQKQLLILVWQILSKSILELKDSNNHLQFINMVFFKIQNLYDIFDVANVLKVANDPVQKSFGHDVKNIHHDGSEQSKITEATHDTNHKIPTTAINNENNEIDNRVMKSFPNATFIKED